MEKRLCQIELIGQRRPALGADFVATLYLALFCFTGVPINIGEDGITGWVFVLCWFTNMAY